MAATWKRVLDFRPPISGQCPDQTGALDEQPKNMGLPDQIPSGFDPAFAMFFGCSAIRTLPISRFEFRGVCGT
jgi:hypothetical protein